MRTLKKDGRRHAALVTAAVVSLVVAAPAGQASPTVATGKPADPVAACMRVARASGDLGSALDPGRDIFGGGTTGDDEWYIDVQPPGAPISVWCGFAGDDHLADSWGWVYGGPGDDWIGENWLVFRGGPGNDTAGPNEGYFDGGPGDDVAYPNSGTFDGGPGDDVASSPEGPPNTGIVNGGPGNDTVHWNYGSGTFNGGTGDDRVGLNEGAVAGGRGNDRVEVNRGTFDGGPGYDTVGANYGQCVNVEAGC